jgi:hypothetical protein
MFLPLNARVCHECSLVQLEAYEAPENIFSDYAYFSSYSSTWLDHAARYCAMARDRFCLDGNSTVVEIASNDGYLLQNFKRAGIPVLGIEPAANVAAVAIERGIPSRVVFFGTETAQALNAEGVAADLLIGNNVLAHVPELNDFVRGLKILLAPRGVLTMEFPHLYWLMRQRQFDTIYHEHFSYFSLLAVDRVFAHHRLKIFDVDELPTHGGSLRIYVSHPGAYPIAQGHLDHLRAKEQSEGLDRLESYQAFGQAIREVKSALLQFLLEQQRLGNTVCGYGAPAKGNTLLNYCGIRTDLLPFTVDVSPHKQGRLLPGSRIPILAPHAIAEAKPAYVLILPWNIREEITQQMEHVRDWGGKFVVAIPELEIF